MLVAIICAAAFSLRELPGLGIFSPAILAVLLGLAFANVVGAAPNTLDGIGFCQKGLLRFAIVTLGFQITAAQVLAIGFGGVVAIVLCVAATFVFTISLARVIGVDSKLAELIAAGTSICGASAIIATNAVTKARDGDVAYAVACITLFGTVAMLGYPLLAAPLGLDQHLFGVWTGASIHEVAQVVGASFQNGEQAGEMGTVAKLARVTLLAPMVVALGFLAGRGGRSGQTGAPPVPWFVLGFIGAVIFNSVIGLPDQARPLVVFATTVMITMGLAALGLTAKISEIRSRGLRPLLLALSAFLFIAVLSLLLIKLLV